MRLEVGVVDPYINQCLYHGRLLLEASEDVTVGAKQQALLQGALNQAATAFSALLQRLALQYGLAQEAESVNDLSCLCQRLAAKGLVSAETQELIGLAEHGWLGSMLRAVAQTGNAIRWAQSRQTSGPNGVLASDGTVDLEKAGAVNAEQIREWLLALREMVDRYRSHSLEW